MKRVPRNRYLLFLLIAGAALSWDLVSKTVVFHDLGYPADADVAQGEKPDFPGVHQRFASPANVAGKSILYVDGWLRFRLNTTFNHGALWGVGQGHSRTFAVLSVLAVLG